MKTFFFLCLTPLFLYGDSLTVLPKLLEVHVGNVHIELSERHFWNLNGIWYRDRMVCQKNKGFYGTVLSYQDLGWVGTGHLENKIGESKVKVEFLADGKPLPAGQTKIIATSFSMKKTSILHQARLHYELLLENDLLREQVILEAIKESDIRILYHFMHPWESHFQEYVLQGSGTSPVKEKLDDSKGRSTVLGDHPVWAALHDPQEKLTVLSAVRSIQPLASNPQWLIWNRVRDRKLYYVPGRKLKMLPGLTSDATMLTCFLESGMQDWVEQAAAKAAELAKELAKTTQAGL